MTHFHFSSTRQAGISNLLYRFMNALLSLSVCCSLIILHICAALEKTSPYLLSTQVAMHHSNTHLSKVTFIQGENCHILCSWDHFWIMLSCYSPAPLAKIFSSASWSIGQQNEVWGWAKEPPPERLLRHIIVIRIVFLIYPFIECLYLMMETKLHFFAIKGQTETLCRG